MDCYKRTTAKKGGARIVSRNIDRQAKEGPCIGCILERRTLDAAIDIRPDDVRMGVKTHYTGAGEAGSMG
jgi:hypothetical protein